MVLKSVGSSRSSQTLRRYPTVIEELCHQFSLADLRKSTNNFNESRIIGKGGFGEVYKGCLQDDVGTDYMVAVKRMTTEEKLGFKNEIQLLCQLRHPNLISLIGICNQRNEKIIVYEYMSSGSLADHLYNRDMEPLSWKKRLEICIGAARGLHYLHSGAKHTVVHRDIKPSNILLDSNMVPKLSDFGIALLGPRFTSKPKPIAFDTLAGTFGYMAPEFARDNTLTDKSDVFSFGMVLLDVVCETYMQAISDKKKNRLTQYLEPHLLESLIANRRGALMWGGCPVEEIIEQFLIGKIAPECWEIFMDITKRCLQMDPNERPIMGEVEVQLEHALSLQEEADIRKTCDVYTLSSTTILDFGNVGRLEMSLLIIITVLPGHSILDMRCAFNSMHCHLALTCMVPMWCLDMDGFVVRF